jgi:hypothetical protein
MPRRSLLCFLAFGLAVVSLSAARPTIRFVEAPLGPGFQHLAQDGDGYLWTGQYGRLRRFDGSAFRDFPFPPGTIDEIVDSPDGDVYVWSATETWRVRGDSIQKTLGDGALMVGVNGGALAVTPRQLQLWRPKGAIVARYPLPAGFSARPILGPSGDVLLPFAGVVHRLKASDLAENRLRFTPIRASLLPDSDWVWAAEDTSGTIWMRDQLKIAMLAPGAKTPQVVNRADNVITQGFADLSGSVWFPRFQVQEKVGVAVAANGALTVWDVTPAGICRGRDGTVWMILGDRLGYVPLHGSIDSFGGELSSTPVALGGRLYAANSKGIERFDEQRMRFEAAAAFPAKYPITDAVSFGGQVVASRLDGYLETWSPSHPPRPLPVPSRIAGPVGTTHLLIDPSQRLWAAYRDGVARLNDRLEPVEFFAVPGNIRPVDMLVDPAGRLWTAQRNGLGLFENSTWRLLDGKSGLLGSGVRTLAWQAGALWVGYGSKNEEFARLTRAAGSWKIENFGPATGHAGSGTRLMRVDERDWLWRGTIERGLQVCAAHCEDSRQWVALRMQDGLSSDELSQNNWFDDTARKHVWWITTKGLDRWVVELDLFTRNPDPLLMLQPVEQRDRTVRFRWSSTYYRHRSALQFRYRILPEQPEWKYVSGYDAEFRNLPWRRHEFQLQARAGRADWYPAVKSAAFETVFPWTRQLFGAGGLLAALMVGARWRVRRKRAATRRYAALKQAVTHFRDLNEDAREPYLASLDPALAREVRAHFEHDGEPLPPVIPLEAPADCSGTTVAGRYLVEELMARGGFATLYRASDLRMSNRPTAIKILDRPGSESWGQALDRELAVLSHIRHPGVVAVFDRGLTPWKQQFLAFEFIEGRSLRQVFESGDCPRALFLAWMEELAGTLDAIHAAGVVHRDIKPENLMIRDAEAGEARKLVVIDLGIATVRHRNRNSMWATQAAGSFDYMAPEQLQGIASPAADVYSYALVLVEGLYGRRVAAYAAEEGCSVPEAAVAMIGKATGGASGAVLRALAYEPRMRPPSVAECWREIRAALR